MRLRLFVEGVEVPVIAAQVSVAPNSPATCSIQIPPLPEGTRLLPRSLVHLFFLDFYDTNSPFPTTKGANNTDTNQSPTDYEVVQGPNQNGLIKQSSTVGDDPDINNARYKLLFGGEVMGFQWTKNQAQRSLVLQCFDWSNYWDYAQQWNNTDLFGPGIKALFSGGSTNLFTDFLEDEGSAIIRILQTPSIQYPNLQGLMGGIVHLLEAIGGSYYYGKMIAGENIFFSLAELRLHINQMIAAYEKDPTASRLLSAGYDSLLGRTLGNLGQQVSIRQAINALMGIIFHETYAQCCPLYIPSSGNSPSGQTRKSVRQDPDNAFIATTADGLLQSIAQVKSSLTLAAQEPTLGSTEKLNIVNSIADMRKTCTDTVAKIKAAPVLAARSFYSGALRSLDQAQAQAKQWQPGVSANVPSSISSLLDAAKAQIQRASDFEEQGSSKTVVPARLNQQIFRPDVWFSAPPRCNVLFPESYYSLTYQRAFMQEPTRLLLKTNNEFFGSDELFDQFYYAPKGFTLKTGGRELQDVMSNGILDHELFTGILPIFEKMGELNIFGARSGTVKGQVPKVGLAQRSTNFLYFKYRFAARQMQISGKFNPYVACGFPALVIDKYVNEESLKLREQLIQQSGRKTDPDVTQLLGTHFLCNFTEVSHSVSQQDGSTNYNCSYARQTDETAEFFGNLRPDQNIRQRYSKDASRTSVVAAVSAPLVHSLGPSLGDITNVEDVTQAYTGQLLPLYQGPARAGTTQPRINVSIGKARPADEYGADVQKYIGSATEVVLFKAWRVTESVPRYRQQTVDLPVEEYIRPGWYGDCWHPSVIGQVYQQFFQTGAITDQQQVEPGNSSSVGVPDAQAEQALQQASKALDADDPNGWSAGLLALDKDSSISAAVSFLVQTYSIAKQQSLDVDDFIRTYTWRPIATMVDMFGTSDLTLDNAGHSVVQGIEGFHSRAFGPYDDLFGLVSPDIENIVGIKRGSTAAQRGDTRARKQQAVQLYVSALQFARAILG